jgi:DNA topoisomerase I
MILNNKDRFLMIVESPNKVKAISAILKDLGYKNIIVQASVGHISRLNDSGEYNIGVDTKTFDMDLKVSSDKKEVVNKLKEQVKLAKGVIIASDPDREGESIAWSLKKFLKIPDDKYIRITYHEITKNAIEKALNNPRLIDERLVEASHTRNCLDKIVGYRLSPVSRKQVNALSVGRCQSAGLKLVVDREKEIINFKQEKYYELYLNFEKNKSEFKAKYIGTDDKEISKFDNEKDCLKVCEECKGNDYYISNIRNKELIQNAPAPFITSTLQQEASNKLGIGVKDVMSYAQKLFEGIDLNGKHVALITYHRSDDPVISQDFIPYIHDYIDANFGNKYINKNVKKTKANKNSQEGHEGIRVVDVMMTPDRLSKHVNDNRLLKLYELIFKRTIASQMTARKISDTQYEIKNKQNKFSMSSKEELFDGWRSIYSYDKDKEEVIKEKFNIGEKLNKTSLDIEEKETQPPSRYTEATLIKTLDKLGIGRPSTYATIISTILDDKRGYSKVDNKKIVPTELGIKLINFLDKNFGELVNSDYTANLEKSLDKIAQGKLYKVDFLKTFYKNLDEDINKIEPEKIERVCPKCGSKLMYRKGRFSTFIGCSNYPKCIYTESLSKSNKK